GGANAGDDRAAAGGPGQCLQHIEGAAGAALVKAAARIVGQQRPAGTAEVLLAYLPFAEDDETIRELEGALAAVALRDGQPDSTLTKALADPLPVRRAAAAEALCRAGGSRLHAQVRPLL